jgi:hypothetical protein
MKASDIARKARGKSGLQQQAIDKVNAADDVAVQQKSKLANARKAKRDADRANAANKKERLSRATASEKKERIATLREKAGVLKASAKDKRKLNVAGRGVLAENPSVGNKAVATALLGLPVGGLSLVGTAPAGYATAKALSTQTGQQALAGQLQIQKRIAAALRAGDFDKYTKLISRYGAMQGEQ